MTSSNGNIFRVTGHLCGKFTAIPVNSHKGQRRGALMFSLICVWINDWVNNREAGDLRCYCAHYDVIVTYPHSMTRARFLSRARSKVRLCTANHRPSYWSNLPCDWPSTAWAYSEQKTENGPWSRSFCPIDLTMFLIKSPVYLWARKVQTNEKKTLHT